MNYLNNLELLSVRGHAYLDYILVAVFIIAPEALGLEGFAETLSYVLGAAHLGVVLFTDFSLGLFEKISKETHKTIELLVGLALILMSLVGSFEANTAEVFYSATGVIVLMVWAITNYSKAEA